MENQNNEIELTGFYLKPLEPTLHFVRCKPLVITEIHYQELLTTQMKLSGNQKIFALVDVGSVKMVTRSAIQYASVASGKTCWASAFVVQTPIARMVFSFIMSIIKTEYPIKAFSDFESAKQWLNELKNQQEL